LGGSGIDGVRPVLAGVFVAEIGDVHRFARPEQLCSWAGLTPRHRDSDTKVHRGRITKQGNHLVRWAAVEAVQRLRGPPGRIRARLADTRGANIAKVAAARCHPVHIGHWRTAHNPGASWVNRACANRSRVKSYFLGLRPRALHLDPDPSPAHVPHLPANPKNRVTTNPGPST
jgi:hypothetical protein